MNQISMTLSFSLLLLLHCTTTSAQSPAAAPVQPPSKDIFYTDNQVAIYQVDKVLLPGYLFGPKSLAHGPSPPKPEEDEGAESPPLTKDSSSALPSSVNGNFVLMLGVAAAAAIFSL